MQRILIVDDDRVQIDVVTMLLRHAGFDSIAAFDAPSAIQLFAELRPDLVILDVHLGDADGRDLLRQFRKVRPEVLILMLTVQNGEDDRVRSLDSGADDFLGKPFGPRELIARVRALFRRGAVKTGEVVVVPRRLQLGPVMLDPMTHEVTKSGRVLDLSPTEFRLLQALMTRANVLVPTLTLLKEVWGHEDLTARNVLRVTANRLRAKLETDPANPRLLRTVSGEGLIFRGDEPTLPPESTDAPVALEVIAELQELVGGIGMQPLQELNVVFARTVAQQITEMHRALANGQVATLAEEAHRLRGSSATLGAQRMVKVSALIEEHARAGDDTDLGELVQQLEQELARFETAIVPILSLPAG